MDQLHMYYDMGCPEDVESHKVYKRWMSRRSVQESLSINQAPEMDNVMFEDEDEGERIEDLGESVGAATPDNSTGKGNSIDEVDIKCRKCRQLLTKGSFIVKHEPARGKSADTCAHIFLHPLSWMKPVLAEGQLDGRLTCPNEKCGANVGKFAWQGLRCSCGAWVVPGFGVGKARVDEVKARGGNERAWSGLGGSAVRLPPGMLKKGGAGNL